MKILLVTPAQAGVHVPDEVDSRFRGNDVVGVIFRRASMGLWATHRNESQPFVTPAQSLP
jgi:hypothetical protein